MQATADALGSAAANACSEAADDAADLSGDLNVIADSFVNKYLSNIVAAADGGDDSAKRLTGLPSWRTLFAERCLSAARNLESSETRRGASDETLDNPIHANQADIYSFGSTTPTARRRDAPPADTLDDAVHDHTIQVTLAVQDACSSAISDDLADVDKPDAKSSGAGTAPSGAGPRLAEKHRQVRPLSAFSVPWNQQLLLGTHLVAGRYQWNSGADSLASHVLGPARARGLHEFLHRLGPLAGVPMWASIVLTIAAIFDPIAGTDPSSWRPGILALFALLLGVPMRLLLLSHCSLTPVKLITSTFDCWMPLVLTLVSTLALADAMQWAMRSLACISLFMNLLTAQFVDALPDRGASRAAFVAQLLGALMTIFVCIGVNAGWCSGLVFRSIFEFGLDSDNLLSLDAHFTSVSNLELFRSAQSILITITVKILVTNFLNPEDCTILKTGCKMLVVDDGHHAASNMPLEFPAAPSSTSQPSSAAVVLAAEAEPVLAEAAHPELQL